MTVSMLALGLAACAAGPKNPNAPARAQVGGAQVCSGTSAARSLAAPDAAGSSLALATIGSRRVALVADEDTKSILTIDLESQKLLATTPLEGAPAQVFVDPDGRVLVTVKDRNELVAFSATRAEFPLDRLCHVPTPAEPIALTMTPDRSTILLTTGWGHSLLGLEARTLATRFEAPLAREPRSVVVSDDGKTAFVSHAVGSIVSTVDLVGAAHPRAVEPMRGFRQQEVFALKSRERIRRAQPGSIEDEDERTTEGHPTCQGFALAKSTSVSGRIFAPAVMVDPGDFESRPDGYGDENTPTEAPMIAVIDAAARKPIHVSTISSLDREVIGEINARDARPECLLPRAAAVDPRTRSLFVTCLGIDAVIAYDATAASPLLAERRRWVVGAGPTGIAIDSEKERAFVWSQFDRTLSSFDVGGTAGIVDEAAEPHPVTKTALPSAGVPVEYALGRILFHAAGDARIAADGRACASCHPDGRDDAITWATPEGPRRSIMLAGRLAPSSPYSWNGNEKSIHDHLGNTFDRLSGKGLRSLELDALVSYLSRMPAPPEGHSNDRQQIERGRAIFASTEAGCSGCHSGTALTDGKNHDVGSKHDVDRQAAFNTPTLRFVGGTGPYFHDGRYPDLTTLLKKTSGSMGRTDHLSAKDFDALEAYLRTL
jgi:DNA-binding beta-propeller fold protein YncE